MTSHPATGLPPGSAGNADDREPASASAARLAGDLPTERHRLSPRVVNYWRLRGIGSVLPLLLFLAALAYVLPWGTWWLRWGVVAVVAVVALIAIVVLPPIRYRVFWYAISETEIDIQHGIIFIKRSVVPMHRVQNLRTERGPVADYYHMTNLKIRTAADSVTLSGLGRAEADVLCDRISELADVADDV